MRRNQVLFLLSGILFFAGPLFLFQNNALAVLKAEGGKEVVVAEPAKEASPKTEIAKPVGFTSRIPKWSRASSASSPTGTSAKQPGTAVSQSNVISAKSASTSSAASAEAGASSSQPLVITATMKPTTVSPPMESFSGTAQPAAPSSEASKGFMGCIIGGTLVKDITLDVCNSKGGRPLMSGGTAATPPAGESATSPAPPQP